MAIPKIIYKYRSWQENENISEDEKFEKRLLTNSEFYISSPRQFNDPFDMAIPKRFDLMTRDQYLRTFLFHLGGENPKKSYEEIFRQANDETVKRYNNPNYEIDLKEEIEIFQKSHGVYCFSETPNNILSWTFYGNNHQGICIGFDSLMLLKHIAINYTKKIGIFKVHYTDEIPEMIPDMDFHVRLDNVFRRLTTKYIDWSYEHEWRLVATVFAEKLIELPREIIKEVYLGSNILEPVKNEIIEVLKSTYDNKVELFTIKPVTTEFKLKYKKEEY